ncbi:MAG: hypothetical protein AAFZ07_07985 [Actinomycetota bacterium]
MSGSELRTSARWRSAPVPPAFGRDESTAPQTGRVTVPSSLFWSGGDLALDLDDPADAAYLYQLVLREGTEADVLRYVHPRRLLELWDQGVWPRAVKEARGPWIARHRCH